MKQALFALLLLAAPAGFLFCAPSAHGAAATDEIFAAYTRGDYDQAARLGEAAHTAPGYAIAARAVLADDVLRDAPCMECLKRAEKLARAAIAADPHHAFGQVWLAVALGYQARLTGAVKARLADTPRQSRAALDQAVADDPQNPFALSALGGWHIEIVRGGGAFLARTLYGATESQALSLFDRALKADPSNVAVHYQIGLSLAGYDPDKFRLRIASEFRAAVTGHADTAYERRMQDRANELLGLVNRGPRDTLDARVRKYQGFAD
jgi:tetratricopeptide (TPR) repeat protein